MRLNLNSSAEFKGINIPVYFIDLLGSKLAMKVTAYLENRYYLTSTDWKYLFENNFAEERFYSPEETKNILCKKNPQSFLDLSSEFVSSACCWCKSECLQLHSHHYPLSRAKGGKETIAICPSCHADYHYIRDREWRIIKEEYLNFYNEFKNHLIRENKYEQSSIELP